MRISGLVRFYNQVRARLKGGIPEEDREEFRDNVREVLFRVEEMCEGHPGGPEGLPGPSRKAYRFLRELDLDRLPAPRPGVPVARPPVKVVGVVATGQTIAERLYRDLDALREHGSALRRVSDDIEAHTSAIEDICSGMDADPSALSTRSRRVYCWLRFLLTEDCLPRHVDALARAREAALRAEAGLAGIHLVSLGVLFRTKRAGASKTLSCSEGFLSAPPEIWDALVRLASGERPRGAMQAVRAYSTTEPYARTICDMASLARPESSARGVRHDLDEAFARVNAEYFDGRLARPNLEWSTVPTARKLGHYHYASDTILISVTLDDPQVPDFALDFVLYHELLHKWQGVRWVNGRHSAHNAAFRAEERRFSRFLEAQAVLDSLSR